MTALCISASHLSETCKNGSSFHLSGYGGLFNLRPGKRQLVVGEFGVSASLCGIVPTSES